jgi:hypothetical protein
VKNTIAYGCAPLGIERDSDSLTIGNDLYSCTFTLPSGGFPSAIRFADEAAAIVDASGPMLSAKLKGRSITPYLTELAPIISRNGDAVMVRFDNIAWCDEDGRSIADFRLALEYEFLPDGPVFVTSIFYTETTTPPAIRDFVLKPEISLGSKEDGAWSYWQFPPKITGQIIQDMGHFERGLSRRDERTFKGEILPFVSFDFGTGGKRDRHIEFFVEGWNSLTSDIKNTATDIQWKGRRASIAWNFQRTAKHTPGLAYQWRNTWGWCMRKWPVQRKHAPFRIYHYLDNFVHYPDDEMIRRIAAEGANVLILHENWRLDVTDQSFPHDPKRLDKVIRACRKHGLRLSLYVRGNESMVRQRFCEPLRQFLKKNHDGIYMDFGTPYGFLSKDEMAPGGRIGFREYDRMARRVREFVGEEGFHISHSGPFFSAIGHTTVDAYLAGEQEKGVMLRNSTLHAYYSGLGVAPSSLWTAAFPTYRTPKALPVLATTAQAPFLHLGTQVPNCSLSHPTIPSVITFARPLWRLWELFDGRTDLQVHSTQSTDGLFETDSAKTGASILIDKDGNALLIAANHTARERKVSVRVNWKSLGLKPGACVTALSCDWDTTSVKTVRGSGTLTATLPAYGVGGWLFAKKAAPWRKAIKQFARPYPSEPEAEQTWADQVADIRKRRYQPPVWDSCFLRLSIPSFPNMYEESLWWDLFENTIELVDVTHPKRPRRLGYLSGGGLVQQKPLRDDLLWPGKPTPWIPLHDLLKADGKAKRLALLSRKGKNEFYSFVHAELSPVAGNSPAAYGIEYSNEIDSDWSRLEFKVKIGS